MIKSDNFIFHPHFVKVKFKYKFQIVGDGKYGNINEVTGEWNGMIKELQDQVKQACLGLRSLLCPKFVKGRLNFGKDRQNYAIKFDRPHQKKLCRSLKS